MSSAGAISSQNMVVKCAPSAKALRRIIGIALRCQKFNQKPDYRRHADREIGIIVRDFFVEFGAVRVGAQHHLRQTLARFPGNDADIDMDPCVEPETDARVSPRYTPFSLLNADEQL